MDSSNMTSNNILAHRGPNSHAHKTPPGEMSARIHGEQSQWPQSRDRKQT